MKLERTRGLFLFLIREGLENECETVNEDCAMTAWSSWSPCSATCEKGVRQRRRYYLNKDDMARCNRETDETEMCVAEIMDCEKARMMALSAGLSPSLLCRSVN